MGAAAEFASVAHALGAAIARLTTAGVPEARADAEVLLAYVLGTSRAGVVAAAHRPLAADAARELAALVARRAGREPLAYLTGEREFWSLPLTVDRRVLVPRPETELVVETALRVARGARRVLDVGTGSGAIAAALARELPRARVWASDREAPALAVARENLARHAPGVALVRGDALAPFRAGAFDLIVGNPPYVGESEFAALMPEVRDHEPRAALVAGPDGLAMLRAIIAAAPATLVAGGWIVLEMGAGQGTAVRAELAGDGRYDRVEVVRDHGGIERVVTGRRGSDG